MSKPVSLKDVKRAIEVLAAEQNTESFIALDEVIEAFEKTLREHVHTLTDILALPNMGDEGRKAKLVAIKAWEITFKKVVLGET